MQETHDHTTAVGKDAGTILERYLDIFEEDYAVEEISNPVTYHSDGDTELLNIGVKHTREGYDEHAELFKEIVLDVDATVIEQSLRQEIDEDPFYGRIVRDARQGGTVIYVADPNTTVHETTEWIQPWAGGGIALGGGTLTQELLGGVMEVSPAAATTGGLAIGAYIVYGSRVGATLETAYNRVRNQTMDTPLYDRFGHGMHDHRNVMIADGIDTICRDPDHEAVAAFHGAAHRSSIDHYLEHPGRRDSKKRFYAQLNRIMDVSVEKYPPDIETS